MAGFRWFQLVSGGFRWFLVLVSTVEIRISKIQEMHFYLIFRFLGFKVSNNRTINLFKGSEDFGFGILSGQIKKYKPA